MNQPSRTFFRQKAAFSLARFFGRGTALFSLLLALLTGLTSPAKAASVTLGWSASPDSTVTGYRVYYGTSSTALNSVYTAGGSLSATISGLTTGQTYYFGVCAYNSAGTESLPSSPASCAIMALPAISLTSPVGGYTATAPAALEFGADVTANGHAVTKVEFLSNGVVVGEDLAAPFTFSWGGVAAGTYSVAARLVYDSTEAVTSATAEVTVSTPVIAPEISLSIPQPAGAYSSPATIPLSANVSPNGHVITMVKFFNGSTLIGESAEAPYAISWSGVPAGNYSIIARLIYDGNASLDSAPGSVQVLAGVSSVKPTIAITSPINGTSGSAPGKTTVMADVAANGQTISKVQFFANGSLIGESTTPPYSVTWSSIAAGSWILQASAVYGQGSSVSSSPVSITVGTLPPPWASSDIGAVKAKGSVWIVGSSYNVDGAGVINSSSDSFRFVYQPLSGDGEMVARIDSMVIGTSGGGSVGIMIRESLTAGSKHAFMGVSSSGVFRWEHRGSTSGSTSVNHFGSTPGNGSWLKLVRSGNTFSGFTSTDGVNWTKRTSTSVSMTSNVHVGFAVSSGSKSSTTSARFSSSQVVP